jgi:hypothetical protein
MRNATRGLITVCAGLVAGAAFGATPALAGPTWVPPGHILGYYGSPGACSSYASSLVLWDADYDCDYRPYRVAQPYALVIQRPVLIAQPILDHDDSDEDDYREPARPAPDMDEPATDPAPAPVVREPSGSAQSEKPAKNKSHKKIKANKAHKDHNQGNAMANEAPIVDRYDDDDDCSSVMTVAAPCTDILAVPAAVTPVVVAPIRPIVPIVPVVHHRPYVGPWHHPWPL